MLGAGTEVEHTGDEDESTSKETLVPDEPPTKD